MCLFCVTTKPLPSPEQSARTLLRYYAQRQLDSLLAQVIVGIEANSSVAVLACQCKVRCLLLCLECCLIRKFIIS